MKDASFLLTATVKAKSSYDSLKENIQFSVCDSIFVESITGVSEVDIQLLYGDKLHADLPGMTEGCGNASLATNQLDTYNRVRIENNGAVDAIVKLRINYFGWFYKTGSGGGGVASHVKIDGKPQVSIPDPVTVQGKVSLDGKFPSTVKLEGAVALAPDTKVSIKDTVTVEGKVSIDGTLPSKVTVDGAVALAPDTAVAINKPVTVTGNVATTLTGKPAISIPDTVNVKLASGTINVDPVPATKTYKSKTLVLPTSPIQILKADDKRANCSVQAAFSNNDVVFVLASAKPDEKVGALSFKDTYNDNYAGDLWAMGRGDGQAVYITESFN
ncbi:hypothetical protein BJAS_P3976 [Bathymodiolus japonicus methanotrophic gill symbiont]|uniref:hypothetical protein n=1 Tax=Bathymodiolus japonicus methanotrophic gill symbiont TaxID=113269 RepID=UPI001B749CD9|nr:hypothetical protein [Bathymodiolus japonicus methanotrophic gill symbiont]GFO73264.1 hypothetical protein BJAS_P3976 [Bathymodiolus japonicus methanotrophic gill symbiont]